MSYIPAVIGVIWVIGVMRELFFTADHFTEITNVVRADVPWAYRCPPWVFIAIIIVVTVVAWPLFAIHEIWIRWQLRKGKS